MNNLIVIPARYGSTRFPGKPLHKLAGVMMFERVYRSAATAAEAVGDCDVVVAVDDERVAEAAASRNIPYVMTPVDCATGSDRVLSAVRALKVSPSFVINFQGDSPLTPPAFLQTMLEARAEHPEASVITLAAKLSWSDLDTWRERKQLTPFSGTSVVVNPQQQALWFSKSILPMIRDEQRLRTKCETSPVLRHIGIYGFALPVLKSFNSMPHGVYEDLEGLEQLRLLEQGIAIQVATVEIPAAFTSLGVDTPEDAALAETYLTRE